MSKPLNLMDHFEGDLLAERIGEAWLRWDQNREPWKTQAQELRNYLFATDTRTTTNAKLPWKNSTTLPKLTAIRDTLQAHYEAAIFPTDDWFVWKPLDQNAARKEKSKAITSYMKVKTTQNDFRIEAKKLIDDFIDYGNAFATVDFRRKVRNSNGGPRLSFDGPILRRVSPYDIVFDPTADRFSDAPKIIRSIKTFGELMSDVEDDPSLGYDKEVLNKLFDKRRSLVHQYSSLDIKKTNSFRVDGFGDYYEYLVSDYVEILELRGDWYDGDSGKLYRDQIITVVDRVYVLRNVQSPAWIDNTVFHVGWRLRPDNLWAMGPLDNLVGMQYRIDHIENAKADAVDQYIHPIKKIKGYVEDFSDEPGERIYMGDDGDVVFERPDLSFLQYDQELQFYAGLMEQMSGAPRDLAGVRTPGNKTLFEVDQLSTNSQKIFINKTAYFEEAFLEKILNSMLDVGTRNMASRELLAVENDDSGTVEFVEVTPKDLSGNGLIKPIGARRFQTQERLLKDLVAFANTPLGQDPAVIAHFSGLRLSQMMEELLGIERFNLVRPNIRLIEQAETQSLLQSLQDQVQEESMTPANVNEQDLDQEQP